MYPEQTPIEQKTRHVSNSIWGVLFGTLMFGFGYYFLQASKEPLLGSVFIFFGVLVFSAIGLYWMFVLLTTARVRTISNDPKEILGLAKKFSRKSAVIYAIFGTFLVLLSVLEGSLCYPNAFCITVSGVLLYFYLFPAAPFLDEFFDGARFLHTQDPYTVIGIISSSKIYISLILNSLLVYFVVKFFVTKRAKKTSTKAFDIGKFPPATVTHRAISSVVTAVSKSTCMVQ